MLRGVELLIVPAGTIFSYSSYVCCVCVCVLRMRTVDIYIFYLTRWCICSIWWRDRRLCS